VDGIGVASGTAAGRAKSDTAAEVGGVTDGATVGGATGAATSGGEVDDVSMPSLRRPLGVDPTLGGGAGGCARALDAKASNSETMTMKVHRIRMGAS
jgi:hypothetical protein